MATARADQESVYSYEDVNSISKFLLTKTNHRPTIGIICGTGLGGLATTIEQPDAISYEEIPGFPVSTVKGHAGKLVFGLLNGKTVVAMSGRFHFYEGYSLHKVTVPVRVFHLLGVKTMIVTNAAGGLADRFSIGDVMILQDHINVLALSGENPLRGQNDERFGPRFPSISGAYQKDLQQIALNTAKALGYEDFIQQGVYAAVGGPSFETPAELRFLKAAGADAVGMSTVHEVIVAAHCGMKCLGISLITNKAVLGYGAEPPPNHEEVLETGKLREKAVQSLVTHIVGKMD